MLDPIFGSILGSMNSSTLTLEKLTAALDAVKAKDPMMWAEMSLNHSLRARGFTPEAIDKLTALVQRGLMDCLKEL